MTRGMDWWPYDFEPVQLSDLIVEEFDGTSGFQREEATRWIEAQVRDFLAARYEPIVGVRVSLDAAGKARTFGSIDGPTRISVIDGRHRWGIAEGRDFGTIPACIHADALDYEARADLFTELNLRRRSLNARQKFRGRHEAKHAMALGLEALLAEYGFYIQGYRPDHANGHRPLAAVGVLQTEYSRNPAALGLALYVMEPWRDLIGRRAQGTAISALCDLARDELFDPERMRRILREFGPEHVLREAREFSATIGSPVNRRAMAKAFAKPYNRGLRSRRLDID